MFSGFGRFAAGRVGRRPTESSRMHQLGPVFHTAREDSRRLAAGDVGPPLQQLRTNGQRLDPISPAAHRSPVVLERRSGNSLRSSIAARRNPANAVGRTCQPSCIANRGRADEVRSGPAPWRAVRRTRPRSISGGSSCAHGHQREQRVAYQHPGRRPSRRPGLPGSPNSQRVAPRRCVDAAERHRTSGLDRELPERDLTDARHHGPGVVGIAGRHAAARDDRVGLPRPAAQARRIASPRASTVRRRRSRGRSTSTPSCMSRPIERVAVAVADAAAIERPVDVAQFADRSRTRPRAASARRSASRLPIGRGQAEVRRRDAATPCDDDRADLQVFAGEATMLARGAPVRRP